MHTHNLKEVPTMDQVMTAERTAYLNGYHHSPESPDHPTALAKSGNSQKSRVAVIGGGPAGLAAAARLSDAGVNVELFEAGQELGGLARSISLWGYELELSAHIFLSPDPFANQLWQESAGELKEITLRRGIFDGHRITEYPMTPARILRSLGFLRSVRGAFELVTGRLSGILRGKPETAEAWMVNTYGRTLHNRFLRDYAEKLWGMTCDRIDARFPKFLFQSADSSKQGQQTFLYPSAGNSSVWKRLGARLTENGVKIHGSPRRAIRTRCAGSGINTPRAQYDSRLPESE